MNDINELIKIIEQLGGSATAEQITEGYCRSHHMVPDSVHKSTVINTLKSNQDKVSFDKVTEKWVPENFLEKILRDSSRREFNEKFMTDRIDPMQPRFQVYKEGAWKLWQTFHEKYDLVAGSVGKAENGVNRNISFMIDGKKTVQIVIGIGKTTLAVKNAALRAATGLEYTECSDGPAWKETAFTNVDECIEVLKKVL